MKKLIRLVAVSSIFAGTLLLALTLVQLQPATASAADKPATKTHQQTKKQQTKASPKSSTKADSVYHYVAQPGDSYSLMARKAIQTYGINNQVKLSGAQIIFAETNLTQAANSPYLSVGEQVNVAHGKVANWVAKAQKLTKSQIAAWHYYVHFVNFDTDHVGEAN